MANYYMIGGDGKEYGPVEAAQLRQWVADGRANGQTQVRSADGGAYTSLAAVPELTGDATATPVAPNFSAAAPSPGPTEYFMRGGDGKEYGPVSLQQLRQWIAEGRANAQTMVRAANGGPYVTVGMAPELSGASSPGAFSSNLPLAQNLAQNSSLGGSDSSALVKRLAAILAEGAGWMKFAAVMMFISGGIYVLTISGIIIAWMPIWLGVVLWTGAGMAQQAVYTGNESDLARALDRTRFYFKLMGIFMIVAFALLILFLILGFGAMMAAAGSGLK